MRSLPECFDIIKTHILTSLPFFAFLVGGSALAQSPTELGTPAPKDDFFKKAMDKALEDGGKGGKGTTRGPAQSSKGAGAAAAPTA